MHITQKTYVSFMMPDEFEQLCKFEQQNDLSGARKYEDTTSVTYEFVQNWYTKGENDEQID